VEQDDELHEVGVGLLQKGSLALPKRLFNKDCDVVGQGVCVESLCRGL